MLHRTWPGLLAFRPSHWLDSILLVEMETKFPLLPSTIEWRQSYLAGMSYSHFSGAGLLSKKTSQTHGQLFSSWCTGLKTDLAGTTVILLESANLIPLEIHCLAIRGFSQIFKLATYRVDEDSKSKSHIIWPALSRIWRLCPHFSLGSQKNWPHSGETLIVKWT